MKGFYAFVDQNDLGRTEGETGCKNLEEICKEIGYKESGFRFGSPIESFLADNPAAIDALYEWIAENRNEEFQEYDGDNENSEDFETYDDEDDQLIIDEGPLDSAGLPLGGE